MTVLHLMFTGRPACICAISRPFSQLFFTCLFCILPVFFFSVPCHSQDGDTASFFSPSPLPHKDRVRGIVFTETTGFVTAILGVNEVWYREFPREKFHFFNDNPEWMQLDKGSHVVTAYYVGKLGMDVLKWGGVKSKKSAWYGGLLGMMFLSSVEVLDGYSQGWGASWGDVAANTAGAAFLIGQEYLWNEQKILFKYSFSKTGYPQYRPELLGHSFHEQMLKDYNGMTFWASANLFSLLNNKKNGASNSSRIPKWLNVAGGFGADGMIGGKNNPVATKNGTLLPYFERNRQFYFSLDVDLTRIKTKSGFLNTFLNAFGFIKFPSPALEFCDGKVKFHYLYF